MLCHQTVLCSVPEYIVGKSYAQLLTEDENYHYCQPVRVRQIGWHDFAAP